MKQSNLWRWLRVVGIVALAALLLLLLPPSLSQWLLFGGGAITLSYGLYQQLPQRQFPSTLKLAVFGIGVICIACALLFFRTAQPYQDVRIGWGLWLVGAFLLGITLPSHADTPTLSSPATPLKWGWWVLGVSGILLAAQGSIPYNFNDVRYGIFNAPFSHHLQALLGLVGVGSILWAYGGMAWAKFRDMLWTEIAQCARALRHPRQFPTRATLLLIVFVALVLRLYNLEYGIHRMVDEIHSANAVADLLYRGDQPLLLPYNGTTAFTWAYPYAQTGWVALFGAGLSPLRIVSVAFGVGTVIALFLLLRRLFTPQVGLIGAAVLAGLPMHIHFSRIGINNIVEPCFGVLALYFLVRGIQLGQRRDFAWAGVCLGLTHYFYEGGRLFYTLFGACWLAWLLFMRPRRTIALPERGNLGTLLFTLVLLVAPLYYAWWLQKFPFAPRFGQVGHQTPLDVFRNILFSAAPLETLWQTLQPALTPLTHFRTDDSFYRGQEYIPLLLLPFFLVGLAVVLRRWRTLGGGLLFWWCAGAVVGLSLLTSDSPRLMIVLPAWAGVIALGLVTLWQKFTPRSGAVLMALALMVWGGVSYFTNVLPDYSRRVFYEEYFNGELLLDYDDLLFRWVALPRLTDVFIVAPVLHGDAGYGAFLAFYGRTIPTDYTFVGVKPDEFTAAYLAEFQPKRHLAFFVAPDNLAAAEFITSRFPTAELALSPYGIAPEKQFHLYFVRNETLP